MQALVLVLVLLQAASRGEVFVVVNPGVRLTAADVRDLYVGEKQFSHGVALVPVDNLALKSTFVGRVLEMTAQRYETLWIKKSFRDAVNPPVAKASDAEVLAYVERTRGAVGYVSALPPGSRLTVVTKY